MVLRGISTGWSYVGLLQDGLTWDYYRVVLTGITVWCNYRLVEVTSLEAGPAGPSWIVLIKE